MAEIPEDDLNCWELYVTDDDKVTCHESGCINDGHFLGFRRRITFGEFKQDLIDHIWSDHGIGKE